MTTTMSRGRLRPRAAGLYLALIVTLQGVSAVAVATEPVARPRAATPPKPVAAAASAARTAAAHAAPKPAAGAPQFTIAPVPAWVVPVTADPAVALAKAAIQYELFDRQVRLEAQGGQVAFSRSVRVINDASGLQPGGQIQVGFDPTYQRLVLHRLQIIRGGQRIDKLDARQVKLLQREQQLERQIYDGVVTASIVLDDLRVGDRVEWAVSVQGANPVFGGRFVDIDFVPSAQGPIGLYQYRLLAPEGRRIRHAFDTARHEMTTKVDGGLRETLVRRRGVPQLQMDAAADGTAWLPELLQWSEFADWTEVSAWAERLFARSQAPSPELRAQVEAIRAAAPTPAERVQRALDFVQNEIRYFGSEMGENSHLPAPPDQVLRQRFGDCKDKVALLGALLAGLDVPSVPALVSMRLRGGAATLLPSPLAFDHVIAQVTLEGRTQWLDGTRLHQRGPVAERGSRGFGQALLARADPSPLVAVPAGADELQLVVEETMRVGDFTADPVFESQATYHRDLAEGLRGARTSAAPGDLEKHFVGEFTRLYPNARPEGAPVFTEVEGHNALQMRQRFVIPGHWQWKDGRELRADVVLGHMIQLLRLPDQSPRTLPMRLATAGIYRQSVRVSFEEDVIRRGATERFDERNDSFELDLVAQSQPAAFEVRSELRQRRDVLPAGEWAAYRDKLMKVFPRLGQSIGVPVLRLPQIEPTETALKDLDRDLRSGKIKVTTRHQVQARMRLIVIDAQIASGRLAPAQLGEALLERGRLHDGLDRPIDGLKDFEHAARLRPDDAAVHAALAVNALARADDAAVDRHAQAALTLRRDDTAPRRTLAYSQFMRGDFTRAREEMKQVLERGSGDAERTYAALWTYLASRRAGADGLVAVQGFQPGDTSPPWPYPVLQYYRGARSFDSVMETVNDERGRADTSKACELYFFAAQKAIADGDPASARRYLQRSIDTGVTEYVEHGLARRELERLGRR